MLYCVAPLSEPETGVPPVTAMVAAPQLPVEPVAVLTTAPVYVPSMSFAFEYEARMAPWPIGIAAAIPYCLALQSLAGVLYVLTSYARPISTTPKFQPPLMA